MQIAEGELLGKVFDGSEESTATDLFFWLIPANSDTELRLADTEHSQVLWLDPSDDFPITYFAPQAGGILPPDSLEVCTGSYADYLDGDFSQGGDEIHEAGFELGIPPGPETHCIVPGHYEVRLVKANSVIKSFFVDYLALGDATVLIGGVNHVIEEPEFSENTTLGWGDLVINFHLGQSGSGFSDSASLQIENVKGHLYKSSFSSQANLTGGVNDWFRFRTNLSTSTWGEGGGLVDRGTMLHRLWWDTNNPTNRSGFFDHGEGPVLRVHQYGEGQVTPPDTVVAGLEIMRPDELPANQPQVTRNIAIEAVLACFDPEATATWRFTDQVLDASCSAGGDLEYRWDTGSGYGTYTSDPILNFAGHTSAGSPKIILQIRDLATSPITTDVDTTAFLVAGNSVSMTGPTYVTDKQLKTYTANVVSDWYEYYGYFYKTLDSASVYNRIWAAGMYTRRLRAQKHEVSSLGRRYLDVEVCHESYPQCEGSPPMEWVASTSVGMATDRWPLLGLGPWIQSAQRPIRLYDLTGLHESGSPFASIHWMDAVGGTVDVSSGEFAVEWRRLIGDSDDVRAFEFTVTPASGSAYRFGFAIDPDVGVSPADDRSGYDATRRLVYAYDDSGAVGFVLVGERELGITAVDQYGASRFAPRAEPDAMGAASDAGIRLTPESDDVQFVVSAPGTRGTSVWRLIVVRGAAVSDLQALVDEFSRR